MNARKTQDQGFMKLYNKKIVLDTIRRLRPISRVEIAKRSGMSPAGITRLVSELSDIGLIQETTREDTNSVGRKAVLLDIVPNAVYTVGIHLDVGLIKVHVVDFDGNIVAGQTTAVSEADFTPERVVEIMWESYQAVLCKSRINAKKVLAIGIGAAGLVDSKKGVLRFSPQLNWHDVPLRELVRDRFSLPVIVENDTKAAARGEVVLSGRYEEDMVFLVIGSGVGSALVSHGEIMCGRSNGAGEIGHIVIEPGGIRCECGLHGCLQTHIASWALVERARRIVPNISDVSEIFAAFDDGKEWARTLVSQAAEKVAVALCTLVNMYNPTSIVIGGSTIEVFPALYQLAMEKYQYMTYAPLRDSVDISITEAVGSATVIGSAILALDKYLNLEGRDFEG